MTKKIKILYLAASPRGLGQLRLDEEVREIEKRILMATERDRFELISQWAVTLNDLQQALLRHKPHIVHFSGHGSQTRGIVLEGKFGNGQLVGKPALIKLFNILKDNVRLVVLNACYSGNQLDELAEVIDFTVGVQTAINDNAAISFAASFYQALAYGRSVRDAFDLGNTCLNPEVRKKVKPPRLLVREGVDASQPFLPELLPEPSDQPPPKWLPEPHGQPLTITIEKKRDLILTIAKIIAGIILISGLYFTGRYIISVRETAMLRQHFKEARDQLANKTPAIRTSAISGLAQLASDPKADFLYKEIIDTLTVFVRNESAKKTDSSVQPVISDNVQDALKVLGWRKHKWQDGEVEALELSSDLSPTNLKGAVLSCDEGREGAHLEGALLNNANLEQARLRGINLQEAVLANANLKGANLAEANLQWANLALADLDEANLMSAKGLTVSQICEAKNYQKAKLPRYIVEALRETPCQ